MKRNANWYCLCFCISEEDQVDLENLSNSENNQGKTYTFPRGQKKLGFAKKSQSLPDSSLCCAIQQQQQQANGGNTTQLQPNGPNHQHGNHATVLVKHNKKDSTTDGWLRKKKSGSKSDGATPSNYDSDDQATDNLRGNLNSYIALRIHACSSLSLHSMHAGRRRRFECHLNI